ncbi:MAG: hypothetical protein II937_09520 [Bacteroidales bacterium]|nr:hypothetical protein [Bacteroidales bacterium]
MDRKLVRGKDRKTGSFVVGYYLGESGGDAIIVEPSDIKYDLGCIDGCPVHECDPKTVGRIAPRNDADGKQVFEGDIIQYEDEYYYFDVTAEVKYGVYLQDGSDGEYGGAKVYGWYVEVISATPPEFDDEAEYPEYMKTTSIFVIPTFKVIGNVFNEK